MPGKYLLITTHLCILNYKIGAIIPQDGIPF
jgi:hypothetical protein